METNGDMWLSVITIFVAKVQANSRESRTSGRTRMGKGIAHWGKGYRSQREVEESGEVPLEKLECVREVILEAVGFGASSRPQGSRTGDREPARSPVHYP